MANSYSVDVFRCEEADVFVATSEDIPGLTLEADTIGGMLEAVMEMVPQLIERNLDLPRDADVQVTVRLQHAYQLAAQQGHSRGGVLAGVREILLRFVADRLVIR